MLTPLFLEPPLLFCCKDAVIPELADRNQQNKSGGISKRGVSNWSEGMSESMSVEVDEGRGIDGEGQMAVVRDLSISKKLRVALKHATCIPTHNLPNFGAVESCIRDDPASLKDFAVIG